MGQGLGVRVKKLKGLRKKPQIVTDNSMVITRVKGWGEVEEGKGIINDDGKRLDLG